MCFLVGPSTIRNDPDVFKSFERTNKCNYKTRANTVPKNKIRIRIGSHTLHGIYQTYENVGPNTALGLIGSRGFLEVAVNQGNAARILKAGKGDAVRVII